ncbi:MAG: hypothetical protein LBK07_00755 [Tannerella sp.]|jgi:hypothetical protein|nr:hypothetical protein [Tannerella sp.]
MNIYHPEATFFSVDRKSKTLNIKLQIFSIIYFFFFTSPCAMQKRGCPVPAATPVPDAAGMLFTSRADIFNGKQFASIEIMIFFAAETKNIGAYDANLSTCCTGRRPGPAPGLLLPEDERGHFCFCVIILTLNNK